MKRTLPDLLLLFVIALAPAQALAVANPVRGLSLGWLIGILVLALFLGAALGWQRPSDRRMHLLVLGTGGLGVFGLTLAVMPDAPGIPLGPASALARAIQLGGEIAVWVQAALVRRLLVNDLLFFLLWALVAWAGGFVAAGLVVRRRATWLPVTAGIALLALVLASSPALAIYAPIQLVAAMVLLGRANRGARWSATAGPARTIRARWEGPMGLALATLLVAISWLTPASLTSRGVAEAASLARDNWQRLSHVSIVHFATAASPDVGGFGTMTFHGPFHLSDEPILRIVAPRPALWRAIVYDTYTGTGWTNGAPSHLSLGADARLKVPTTDARATLVQEVTVLATRGNYLVGAANPVAFDRSSTLQAYPVGPAVDLVSAQTTSPPSADSTYAVTSEVSTATAEQLRAAGTRYPTEITTRYLPLPTLPGRVRRLARHVTFRQHDPYDQALAIEAYLKTLTYSENVPAPPAGRDGVDYFLFQTRAGYCDYFASAMAVMLRSVGVPARVVSGYATGAVQPDGSYLVRDASAHSWTEAYFPGYGWIPFDPTPGFSDPPRGPQNAPPPSANPVFAPVSEATPETAPLVSRVLDVAPRAAEATTTWAEDHSFPLLGGLGGAALLAAGLAGWVVLRRGPDDRAAPVAVYARMVGLASALGVGPRDADTPREFARALARTVPEASEGIDRIAAEYSRFVFGRRETVAPTEPLRWWRSVRAALVRRALRRWGRT